MHMHSSLPDIRVLRTLGRTLEPFLSRLESTDEDLVSGTWIPPVDVVEEGDRILLRAELPGVPLSQIDISFAEGVLSIRGERQFEKESETRRYHRVERAYGSFARSFTLPRTVDPDAISASYTDGVLEISVPKRDEARPRQIRIDVK